MKPHVLILGLGRMGEDIGGYLLGRGMPVSWVTRRSPEDPLIVSRLEKIMRTVARSGSGPAREYRPQAYRSADTKITPPSVVIECIEESLEAKRAAVDGIGRFIENDTLLLSNSSSVLPLEIHPRCVGMHFFQPVALTTFVEIIEQGIVSAQRHRRLLEFTHACGCAHVLQDERSAFAANRMLLPLQTEAIAAAMAGCDPAAVNTASRSALLATGVFSLMDMVGLDVILGGVESYIRRMPSAQQHDYEIVPRGLKELVAAGKLGRKNNNGLLCGAALPWSCEGSDVEKCHALMQRFLYVLVNTCCGFIEKGINNKHDIGIILKNVWQTDRALDEILATEGKAAIAAHLNRFYDETGRSYFKPSALLF